MELNLQARARAIDRWAERISAPGMPEQRLLEAIQLCLHMWTDRRGRGLTFRLVQVLSNHGCFGKYLHRINREVNERYAHCGVDQGTTQHTLEVCPAWAVQRRVLVQNLGRDLSLSSVILGMLGSDQKWAVMTKFCEEVTAAKEDAEWARRPFNTAGRPGRPGRGISSRGTRAQIGTRPRGGTAPPLHNGGRRGGRAVARLAASFSRKDGRPRAANLPPHRQ